MTRIFRRKVSGIVLWEGSSPLDDAPITAIATLRSANRKTGNMIQVWIMRSDIHPWSAVTTGGDYSVCGKCPHRGVIVDGRNRQRSCYVNVEKAPTAVWRAYKRGDYLPYDSLSLAHFRNRRIRWGAYGDPALIPERIVRFLSFYSSGHTGYTHLWRDPRFAWAKHFVQASCDSFQDYLDASSDGWGTFNVRQLGAPLPAGQTQCPAVEENPLVTCSMCTQCAGAGSANIPYRRNSAPKHISVEVHGRGKKHYG